ncbi:MAG: serine/threonine-protein kinase [Verrucomicrobiota bacterium]
MSDSPHQIESREKTIFLKALEQETPREREEFVAQKCRGDEALLERVNRLLKSGEDTGHPLDADSFSTAKEELEALSECLEQDSRFMADLGETIVRLGDYELIEEVGRGAAGVVFRAKQVSLNREVAVKVILGSTWVTSAGRSRFRLEAEAAASLNHRHIVPIHEIGQHDGHDFYSMAYISGGTLRDHLHEIREDRRSAVSLMAKVARTMQIAHEQGILHRDLKPGNILLDETGEPLISDFGLAFDLRQNIGLTLTGQILGTPQYMAPEQAGVQSGAITTHADIYSLGAILYELLSGRPVLEADSLTAALRCLTDETPTRLRLLDASIDRDLETIVAKCLEKNPVDRYDSARSLADDLEAWIDRRPISARAQTPAQRLIKWISRKPVEAGLVGSIFLLLLSFGIGGPLVAIEQASLRKLADEARDRAETTQRSAERAEAKAIEAAELANKRAYANRRLAYASNMRLISTAAHLGTTTPMATQTMLTTLRPDASDEDFRGWEWYYTFGQLHSSPIQFRQKGKVNSIDFSPFGEFFLVSNKKGTTIFDTLTRAIGRSFTDGEEHLFSSWSRNGETIVTLGQSGKVKVWNAKTAAVLSSLPIESPGRSISLGHGGAQVAVLEANNTISFWASEESPKSLRKPIQPPVKFEAIAWSPDNRYLAGIGNSKTVFIWDLDDPNTPLETYPGHRSHPTTLTWKSDSSWLATGDIDGAVRIWGVPGGLKIANAGVNYDKAEFYRDTVTALAWDPDGPSLINTIEGFEGLVLLDFSLNSHDVLHEFEGVVSAVVWSGDAHSIVAGNSDGKISIWRHGLPVVSEVVLNHGEPVSTVAWSGDGATLVCRSESDQFFSFLPATGQVLSSVTLDRATSETYAWSPNRRKVAAVPRMPTGDQLLIVDLEEKEERHSLNLGTTNSADLIWPRDDEVFLLEKNGGVLQITLDGEYSANRLRPPGKEEGASFSRVSASPDLRYILASSDDGGFSVIATDSGEVVFESKKQERRLVAHAWHPDSLHFATCSAGGAISIWSLREKEKVREFKSPSGIVGAIAWHPHGNRLASGGEDGDLFLWDWENGEPILQLHGHSDLIADLSWDQSGQRLASTSRDGAVRVWDATAGVLLSRDLTALAPPK